MFIVVNQITLTIFAAWIFTGQWINDKTKLSSKVQSIYFSFSKKSFLKGIKLKSSYSEKGLDRIYLK